ncbi:MAG: rRNA maturation RNase YbeY [Myxococcota bacterium]
METSAQSIAAQRIAQRVLRAARLGDLEVQLSFVSDEEIRALNRDFRLRDRPTDVLSFSAIEGEALPGTERFLGDIVISLDTAQKQAKEFGHAFEEEIAVLVVHGLLHLLGYDHELGVDAALAQAEGELSLLDICGVDPQLALLGRSLF